MGTVAHVWIEECWAEDRAETFLQLAQIFCHRRRARGDLRTPQASLNGVAGVLPVFQTSASERPALHHLPRRPALPLIRGTTLCRARRSLAEKS